MQDPIVAEAEADADPPGPVTVTVTVCVPPSTDNGTVAEAEPPLMLIETVLSMPVATMRTCALVALPTDTWTVPW